MSDTYRANPYAYKHYRSPKRNVMSKDIDHVRRKAIPPNAFDDYNFSHNNMQMFSMIKRMKQKNMSISDIAWRLSKKCKLDYITCFNIVDNYCSNN